MSNQLDIIDELNLQANLVSTNNECLEPGETKDDTGVYMRAIAEIRRLRSLLGEAPKQIVNAHDDAYAGLLRHIKTYGKHKADRTGTGTTSIFGYQMRFDLQDGFPLLTTKKVSIHAIAHELFWFLSGSTNIKYLKDNDVKIWNEWADENGDLGPVYGSQWRNWSSIKQDEYTGDYIHSSVDQITNLMNDLRNNADSRRLIVSAWNVAEIPNMKLPPCHAFFQFYTTELTLEERTNLAHYNEVRFDDFLPVGSPITGDLLDSLDIPRRRLSCQLYQRSADVFLGVPFNIASYALLTHMIAQQLNMVVGEFIWTGGDCHIYDNHQEQVLEQLSRTPTAPPTIKFVNKPASIFDYKLSDFVILGYNPQAAIKAPVAV